MRATNHYFQYYDVWKAKTSQKNVFVVQKWGQNVAGHSSSYSIMLTLGPQNINVDNRRSM